MPDALPLYARACAEGLELRLKVVPGASRSRVVGLLGERLKVQVAAAPEAGKANKAVCACLAAWLGCAPQDVSLIAGSTRPQKTVRVPLLPLPAVD